MSQAAMAGKKFSSYHLAAALRREPDPAAALRLFLNPTTSASASPAPFRYSLRCYDLIISKLAAARLFPAMESILSRLAADSSSGTRLRPREQLLCRVVSAYGSARLPAAARRAFAHPAFPGPRTARALNALLHALLACRAPLRDLLAVCGEARIAPDACTYNILMRAEAASGSLEHTRNLFDEMLQRGIAPTVVTFGTVVSALCDAGQLEDAFEVKDMMVRRYDVSPNAYVYASLMKGLCEKGDVDAAVMLKEEMVGNAELVLDSAVYATLVRALFRDERDPSAAFAVLDDMQKSACKADAVTYNTLVAGLCKLGQWRDASELVEDMPRRGCPPDVVTFRMLFDGMCAAGEFLEADQVLNEMVFKGFAPSKDGVRKFVKGIERGGNAALLESVLCRLAKVNALESSEWEKAKWCAE
nr:unnamed protein product [Digitaria exilis]